jgi:predicted transposase/invertase (TIGR01784 family)
MGRFVNPFTDTGFKILFGQDISKPLLIDFLNNLLKGSEEIVDLKFLDKEKPRLYKKDRGLIYDIYCETSDNKKIIVEMQNRSQEYFVERSIYYVSQAISRQGKRGEWDYNFDSVYFVAFMNFTLTGLTEFRTDVQLYNCATREVFSDKMKYIYLQLPYFTKEEEDCKTDFDRWIYIFKNMEILNRIPWAAKNSVFMRLGELAEVANMSEKQRRSYDKDLKILRDSYNILEFAKKEARREGLQEGREEGRAEGREEGRAEGRAEGVKEMAVEMLKKGMDIELVSEISKLSIDDVRKLRRQLPSA